MNITPLSLNNLNLQKQKAQSNHLNNNSVVIQTNSLNYLGNDKVNFTAKVPKATTIEDAVRKFYDEKLPFFKSSGVKLMDTLEVISNKFKDRGVSFDRKYAEHGIVKKTDSFISKFIRSGASPQDRIRTTLYVENPYDFKLIKDILSELKLRGYEIKRIPEKINGTKIQKPDFDIRLPGVTEQDTKILGAELQKCIGKPQKTGYEDIQMRLMDTNVKSKNAYPIELLIVYGKNFAKAKEAESYYSYDIRRMLKGLLHIAQIENPAINTPAHRVQNNIKIISEILSNNISKPLFYNAKNLDFNHEKFQLPVELSKSNCDAMSGLFEGMRSKITTHYRHEAKRVTDDAFKPELEKLVKMSSDYKERTDKTIYIDDLIKMKKHLLKSIKTHRREDIETLKEAQNRLNETIEKYGKKA